MKSFFIIGLAVLVGFLWTGPVTAQEKITDITFASEEWANATGADGTGLYWDIFRAVYGPEGISVKHLIRSYSGSMELVKRQKVDAAVGAYIDEVEDVYYSKGHFALDVVQAIFKKGSVTDWKGQETLKGKRVAWIHGYSLDEHLEVPVEKIEFEDRPGALRALEKGRYDFFIDAQGDLIDALNTGIIDKSAYEIETIQQLNLYLVFAKNAKGKSLQEIFDRNFPKLIESGKIKALYAQWKKGHFTYPFPR